MKKYFTAVLMILMLLASQTAIAQLKKANKRYDRKEYARAIPLYQRHLEKLPTSEEGMEKLANSYRMINDSRNAEYWYNRLAKSGNKDPQNTYYHAQMLINNEKWEEAIPLLEAYLQERDWDEVAQNMLKSAQSYKSFMADSAMYIVKNTNINTPKAEFSPTIYRNSLVFASSRTPAKNIFNWTGDNFLDLYQAQYFGKAELGEAQILPGSANSKYHEGGSTFSPDGNVMYFTRNDFYQGKLSKGENGLVRLKTYKAELVHNKWENISEVPFNGEEFSVGHPCLSPDGNTFYFVSDMTGGEGGTDIYMVRKQGEEWGKPENMGPRINTPANDMFPWISPTGVFYFASNGHPGLGGLDLFRVTSLGTEFEKVQNMGYPVNSPKDDFSLVIDEKSSVGFFSSNRKGGKGDDDIYSFIQRQVLEGLVVDASTNEPMNNAKVEIYGVKGLSTVLRTDSVGHFRYGLDRNMDYKLVGSADHYLESAQVVSTVSFDPTVPVEAIIKLDKDKTDPIYTLKGKLEADTVMSLEGTKVRIIAKEVVVTVDENGNFEYHLAPDTDYEVRVEKEGFIDKVMDVTTKGMAPGDLNLNAMLMRLMPDTALYRIFYDYNDAYVRSDAYKELDRVLDFLRRNPTAKIRLVSHADPRGTESYNDHLSKQRTNNAFAYLIRHGIDKNRLEQIWLGERSPKNKCRDGVDCTEEEYQQNRQTEIQFGGKVRDREMPRLEAVPMDGEEPKTKEDLKIKLESSGKEKMKEGAVSDPKEEMKAPAPEEGTLEDGAKTAAPTEPAKEMPAGPVPSRETPAVTEPPKETPAPVEPPKEGARTADPAATDGKASADDNKAAPVKETTVDKAVPSKEADKKSEADKKEADKKAESDKKEADKKAAADKKEADKKAAADKKAEPEKDADNKAKPEKKPKKAGLEIEETPTPAK